MVIHRDGSMMYYVYIRRLDAGRYIGFAIVINGYYLDDIRTLFSMFEKETERLLEAGVIINFKNDGNLTTTLTSFQDEEEEAETSVARIQKGLSLLKGFHALPAIDYSIAPDSRMIFKISDYSNEIIEASYRHAFTIILKDRDYATARVNSIGSLLNQLNNDKNLLIDENEKLREANKKILRQKKQFKFVAFLLVVLFSCGIVLYVLSNNLSAVKTNLTEAHSTISEKETDIRHLRRKVNLTHDSLKYTQTVLGRERNARRNIGRTLEGILRYAPFAVNGLTISSGQLICDYYSAETRDVVLTVAVVDQASHTVQENSQSLRLLNGDGAFILDLPVQLNPYRKYYVMLIYKNQIIAGQTY